MIKVLMLGNHPLNKGGMTSVISQIRDHDWSRDGISLSFIPTYIPGNPVKKILFFIIALIKILWIFAFSKPDIVYMHMSYKGSFTRKYIIHKICMLFSVKDIVHLHGSEFEKWYNSVSAHKKNKIKKLLSGCSKFIVLGCEWKNVILKIEPSTNIFIINNGIKIPKYTVHWNEKVINVIFLGVLIPRKGVADLIHAVKNIKNNNITDNIKVIIAGTGEEEDELKSLVKAERLEDIVSFEGWITGEKKKKLFLHSQILVSPSYNEGLPISILEAASYGLPIVSTNVGDISSVVKDGVNGYLIQPGDIEALSEHILLMTDKQRWEKFSHMSRKIAEEQFSIDLFYSRLLDIWNDAVI